MYVSKRQIYSWAEQTKCNNLLLRKKTIRPVNSNKGTSVLLGCSVLGLLKYGKVCFMPKWCEMFTLPCLRVGCNYYHQCHICFFALLAYESDLPLREARNCLFNTNSIIMLSKPWAVITWIRKCCLPTSVTFQSLRIQLCLLTPQTGMTWMRWILPNLDE